MNAQKLPCVKVESTSVTLTHDAAGKSKLTDILGFCFDTLKTYGKEPEQLASANRMFQFVLADYPIEKISEAFKYYFSTNSEMPTPADIVSLIKRGNRPAFDKSVYIRLEKKGYDSRTRDEDEYMKDYEEFMIYG